MESLLEYIVPIIIGAFYLFNFLKKGDDADESGAPPRQPPSREDSEAIERQRKVQEEIRRKIRERREAAAGRQTGAPVASNSQESAYDRQQRQRREANQAYRESREVVKEVKPPPIRTEQQPPPIVQNTENEGGFSWDKSDNAYETQMQERLRQIEATKRQAEQLKRQTAARRQDTKPKRKSSGSRTFSGPIRDQLKDPAAARAAFIYGEVLGQPVSMRKQSSVPGLSS
ncbi:MAG: hypothetical protein ACSHYA_00365 [Opitutaceae bacterium]